MKNKKIGLILYFLLPILFLCNCITLLSQNDNTDDMKIMMDKVKADKKVLVLSNMDLTKEESSTFWPLYEDYQKDLSSINDKYKDLINDYADAYNNKIITNESALHFLEDAKSIADDETKLLEKYSKKFLEILPAIKAFRYLQIENKIRAAIKYELATKIPLIK